MANGTAEVQGRLLHTYLADSPMHPSAIDAPREDVFYEVTVPQPGYLNAQVDSAGLLPPSLDVAVTGGSCGNEHVLGHGLGTATNAFVVAGTYRIRITALERWLDPEFTGFVLKVWTTPGSREIGNHCDLAKPIADFGQVGGSQAQIAADTRGLFPVAPDPCDEISSPLPDQVYLLELQERSELIATVQPTDPATAFQLELIKDDCFSTNGQCQKPNPGATITVKNGPLDPGRYFLHVRSIGSAGAYTLQLQAIPWAKNVSCASAEPLNFVGGVATASADARYTDASQTACDGIVRALHYKFSTQGMGRRSVRIKLSSAFNVVLSVSSGCPDGTAATKVACNYDWIQPDGTQVLDLPDLPEGDYGIQVVGNGPMTLTAELGPDSPPPPNDTCTTPQVLTLSGGNSGNFSASGDTRGANDSFWAYACLGNGTSQISRDVVYYVPFPGRARLDATVIPTLAGFDPNLAVSITPSCNLSDGCSVDGGVDQSENVSMVIQNPSDAGVYIWVDGAVGSAGTFNLTGTITKPPPEDVCSGAAALPVGTTNGSISLAFNDPSSCMLGADGPDVFYAFTAGANGTETITLSPAGFDGALWSSSGGCGGTCLSNANSAGVGGTETLSFPVTKNGVYIIGVDSVVDSSGAFSITRSGP